MRKTLTGRTGNPMDDSDQQEKKCNSDGQGGEKDSAGDHNWPMGITLEAIVDATGEFEHLNELIMLQIEKSGGLKNINDYFTIVTPILDLLEVEIRVRSVRGITQQQMKLLIQDWIDKEIAEVR
jgi:hypothetical protein